MRYIYMYEDDFYVYLRATSPRFIPFVTEKIEFEEDESIYDSILNF